MSGLRVLISGASVAGPALAYFLARSGAKVIVIERASSFRKNGQNIDIRGAGIEVIRRMGIEDAIRAATTGEAGLRFVDEHNTIQAELPAEPGNSKSPTSEIEILRGQLAEILYERSKDEGVEYIFGNYITAIHQKANQVQVEFSDSSEIKEYDLVIAADGQNSKTRALAFGDKANDCVDSLGQYMMYFTISRSNTDTEWARWYNAPNRRCILIRPDNLGTTRVVLAIIDSNQKLEQALEGSLEEQKAVWHHLFVDAGWEANRALQGLATAKDCYMHHVAQVKMPCWSNGRVALVGDSAFAPSPISGMGTTCALVGSYVLASAITKHGNNIMTALQQYEKDLRPLIENAQKLAPGGPKLLNPETRFGIKILDTTLWFLTATGLNKLLERLASSPADTFELPEINL